MRVHKFNISLFKCPDCGLDMFVPREIRHKRKIGHIKDLYCVRCGKIQKMKENEIQTLAEKEGLT